MDSMNQKQNIAILWDIENVTPSADSLFVEGLIEYAESLGKIAYCRAYADWTKKTIDKISMVLAENSFELIHVPRSRKNSSDISLITGAIELLYQYPHITRYILITGDSDFRSLLLTFRKQGRETFIICDAKTASEDLLSLADDFKDFRDLLPTEKEDPHPVVEEDPADPEADRFFAYGLLMEAVDDMIRRGKKTGLGAVKVRMRILNKTFDEGLYGFDSWSEFIAQAVESGYIELERDDKTTLIKPAGEGLQQSDEGIHVALRTLIEVLSHLDGKIPHSYHSFGKVNDRLKEKNIIYNQMGFKKLKDFIQAAEMRGLVETKNDHLKYYVKRL
ncbi:NYN domain-containing protein [Spirochaeta cellobiosiphila]|uniref:NYN domain-containing protein n=1 Tax=Spirochaeta cellobiosiphila TaxID=504483 RepID=UPI000427A3DB|nr:NYN domain-containing protein [Spirochaeta cellobiosiphila]